MLMIWCSVACSQGTSHTCFLMSCCLLHFKITSCRLHPLENVTFGGYPCFIMMHHALRLFYDFIALQVTPVLSELVCPAEPRSSCNINGLCTNCSNSQSNSIEYFGNTVITSGSHRKSIFLCYSVLFNTTTEKRLSKDFVVEAGKQ